MPLEVRLQESAGVEPQKLAALAYAARRRDNRLSEGMSTETVRARVSDGLASDCHEQVLVAERDGQPMGWLAFYELSDLGIAQIWDWHPVVSPVGNAGEIASALIRGAVQHVKALGIPRITVDFVANQSTESALDRRIDWYARAGVTERVEEQRFSLGVRGSGVAGEPAAGLPAGTKVGSLTEAPRDALYTCWEQVFATGQDSFYNSLEAQGRRDFFATSWSPENPVIDGASLALYADDGLIGFCRFLPDYTPGEALLAPIGILAEHRMRGLGRALLEACMGRLRELGHESVNCYVSTGNVPATAFYRGLGFAAGQRIVSLIGQVG